MRKVLFVVMALLLCLSLSACGTVSSEKAIDIALEELQLSRITTSRVDAELDKSTSPATYRVVIYQAYTNQIVIVNAETGDVLSVTEEDANRD